MTKLITAERTGGDVAAQTQAGAIRESDFSAVETIPFGGDRLAHNRATGALCILNGTAGEFLALLQAGRDESEAARLLAARYGVAPGRVAGDLARLKAALTQAGLLGPAGAGAPQPDGGAAALDTAPPRPLAEPAFDAVASCGGGAVRLRCEEATLGALLAEVLRPALSPAAPAASTIELAGAEGSFECRHDGRLVWSCGPRPLARRNLLREAIVATLPAAPAALLHASAVVTEGRAAVLAGDSGSGKTTLAVGLVGCGGRLVADDLLPLLADGRLAPVPFAFSVKQGSWPILAPLFPEVARLPVLTSRGLKVRYLWPGAARAAGAPQPPAAILFPAHRRAAAPEWRRLTPRDTLERLIDTGTSLEPADGAPAALARLAADTPAFAVQYDRLQDGVAAVGAILAEV